MRPEVSVIVVNHRSAPEASACLASLREAFERERIRGEALLVDCASGPEEAERLQSIPADARLFLSENRGYSGGLNAGLARARAARLILSNADVVYAPGALSALLAALEDGRVGAAAPLCVWDASGRLFLPADLPRGFGAELASLVGGRLAAVDDRRFAAFARQTLRLWREGGDAGSLVGAVLGTRRDVFDRAGRFDERFLFEYEETEWEERVRRAGYRLRFVPRARVRHLFAVSASRSPEAPSRREASRRLYRRMRYGGPGRALLERLERRGAAPAAARVAEPVVGRREGAWLAVSTNPSLIPFAGAELTSDFRLPEEIVASLPSGPVYLRAFRETDGHALQTFVWEKA